MHVWVGVGSIPLALPRISPLGGQSDVSKASSVHHSENKLSVATDSLKYAIEGIKTKTIVS
ncbi:hypothetical protein KSB_77080 [Ktedonobacter robiniae]|uniref:Uncharacterized protein n=1 Tax=Ktedonobacter robiniae TaxID=2778365 RepID=A0ABQ3V2Q1_9CHLR|nr:hypothetical protein KSB_77080 [Ktedonobacter robiniae]